MFLRAAKAPFTFCIYIHALLFPPFRIPNHFSSFPSSLWKKRCGSWDSKSFGDTVWTSVKLDSKELSPPAKELAKSSALQRLSYLCSWRPILSESVFRRFGRSIIREAFDHPFWYIIKLSKGLEEVQNKHCNRKLSGPYYAHLWFCPWAWSSSGTKNTQCRSSAVLHCPTQLWEEFFLCWHKLSPELKPIQIFSLKLDIFSLCLSPSITLPDFLNYLSSESLLTTKITISLVYLRNQSKFTALKKWQILEA